MDLFFFNSKLLSSTFQASASGLKYEENGINQYSNLIKGQYDRIKFPVVFKHDYGKKMTDMLDTGSVSLFLISEKFKIVLQQNNLTGWKTFPIKLYDKKGNEILGYEGLSVLGRSGPLNYSKSQIIEKQFVPNGPIVKYYKGVNIDNWDGSDFFIPDTTVGIGITQKTVNAITKNKITNVRVTKFSYLESGL